MDMPRVNSGLLWAGVISTFTFIILCDSCCVGGPKGQPVTCWLHNLEGPPNGELVDRCSVQNVAQVGLHGIDCVWGGFVGFNLS
jgi:hypothetical protein